MEGGGLKLATSKVGKTKLPDLPGGSPKARPKQGGTGGIQLPWHAIRPKPKQPHMSHVGVRTQLSKDLVA
jgi:hypothetical protein